MTKDEWLEKSLQLLCDNDIEILKIDILCKELNITKGSFYHHFKNHKNFLDELLNFWHDRYTLNIIREVQKHEDNYLKQIEIIMEMTYSLDLNIEIQFRAFALKNSDVRVLIEQIDKQRIELLTSIQKKMSPKMKDEEAQMMATYIYTQFIGSLFIQPRISIEKQKRMDEMLLNILLERHY